MCQYNNGVDHLLRLAHKDFFLPPTGNFKPFYSIILKNNLVKVNYFYYIFSSTNLIKRLKFSKFYCINRTSLPPDHMREMALIIILF